ncbi:MAG: TerD family protein [Cetobacterium sp.]|uniref:TerD family protein n=1 Tax=Cetobacterium sp. TaxID=2071632 RepID=UPI003F3B6BA5
MNNGVEVISLAKGEVIDLSKKSTSKNFEFRAQWDESKAGPKTDIDITALICGDSGKVLEQNRSCLVFYGNLKTPDGSITHSGDERTGSKEGWDEVITFDFNKMRSDAVVLPLILSIDKAQEEGLNFGLVKNLKVDIFDVDNKAVLATFEPDMTNSVDISMIVGEFIIRNGAVNFKALAKGTKETYNTLLTEYGLLVK